MKGAVHGDGGQPHHVAGEFIGGVDDPGVHSAGERDHCDSVWVRGEEQLSGGAAEQPFSDHRVCRGGN